MEERKKSRSQKLKRKINVFKETKNEKNNERKKGQKLERKKNYGGK